MTPRIDSYRTAQNENAAEVGSRDEDADTAFFGHTRTWKATVAMEHMAARMAHDFNNYLTSITGLGSLVECDLDKGIVRAENIRGILEAADRARALTSDLLSFSRNASRDCRGRFKGPIDLNAFLAARKDAWATTLGSGISLEIVPCPKDPVLVMRESALAEAFDRILENARDFLPGNGTVSVVASRRALGEAFCAERGLIPGDYVAIRIADDGPGMTAETWARAFDPFFTTRAHQGSRGLGLAVAHGLVRDALGHVELTTRPGEGSTFTFFFPVADESPQNVESGTLELREVPTPPSSVSRSAPNLEDPLPLTRPQSPPRGKETILVVEDEPMVRELVTRSLSYLGYHVLKAGNGQEGFEMAESHASEIDLIFSDIVMPRMGGPEMVQRLREAGFDFRVLFTTGFTENQGIMENGELRAGVHILPKPYATRELADRIRDLLDQAGDQ